MEVDEDEEVEEEEETREEEKEVKEKKRREEKRREAPGYKAETMNEKLRNEMKSDCTPAHSACPLQLLLSGSCVLSSDSCHGLLPSVRG
ncbi:hypothetical protein M0804_008012 [Polistes exclamans]|nr:hypothetical protein M0804_008012 [Polistes exclamans]